MKKINNNRLDTKKSIEGQVSLLPKGLTDRIIVWGGLDCNSMIGDNNNNEGGK